MKKILLITGVVVLSLLTASVNAQEPEKQPTTQPATQPSQPIQTWDYKKNPTVVAITSQYESKYITSKSNVAVEDIFPVIGKYESTVNMDAPAVLIMLDETNKGIVWIDGIPQGRVKAILRKSPATYKIPAQKLEDGKEVAEGTLIYDKDANTLQMVIGKPYNNEDPASVFAVPAETTDAAVTTTKTKTKVKKETKPKAWVYSGSKVVVVTEPAAATPVNQ
jgi:hypothetical protein